MSRILEKGFYAAAFNCSLHITSKLIFLVQCIWVKYWWIYGISMYGLLLYSLLLIICSSYPIRHTCLNVGRGSVTVGAAM